MPQAAHHMFPDKQASRGGSLRDPPSRWIPPWLPGSLPSSLSLCPALPPSLPLSLSTAEPLSIYYPPARCRGTTLSPFHRRASMAHIRQSRPDFGLGFQVNRLSCPLCARKRSARGRNMIQTGIADHSGSGTYTLAWPGTCEARTAMLPPPLSLSLSLSLFLFLSLVGFRVSQP